MLRRPTPQQSNELRLARDARVRANMLALQARNEARRAALLETPKGAYDEARRSARRTYDEARDKARRTYDETRRPSQMRHFLTETALGIGTAVAVTVFVVMLVGGITQHVDFGAMPLVSSASSSWLGLVGPPILFGAVAWLIALTL